MLEFLALLADTYHGRRKYWYVSDRFVSPGRAALVFTGFAWYFDYSI